jgi:hypothetical protein
VQALRQYVGPCHLGLPLNGLFDLKASMRPLKFLDFIAWMR